MQNEQFEILAMRLARIALEKHAPGRTSRMRGVAKQLLSGCETSDAPPIPPKVKFDTIPVHIRWMIRRDMAEVIDIEMESFVNPWTEDEFIKELRKRNCIGMAAEHDERVIGYTVYALHKTRIELLNVAVHKDYRGRGIGRQLCERLMSKLSPDRRRHLFIDVADISLAAHSFCKAVGFRAIGIIPERFGNMDAYRFRYTVHVQTESEVSGE